MKRDLVEILKKELEEEIQDEIKKLKEEIIETIFSISEKNSEFEIEVKIYLLKAIADVMALYFSKLRYLKKRKIENKEDLKNFTTITLNSCIRYIEEKTNTKINRDNLEKALEELEEKIEDQKVKKLIDRALFCLHILNSPP